MCPFITIEAEPRESVVLDVSAPAINETEVDSWEVYTSQSWSG